MKNWTVQTLKSIEADKNGSYKARKNCAMKKIGADIKTKLKLYCVQIFCFSAEFYSYANPCIEKERKWSRRFV